MKSASAILSAVFLCFIIVSMAAPPMAHAANQYIYYASPTGSGSTCSFLLPCSLTGARTVVRSVNQSMSGDVRVLLRGGKYYLSSPFTLTSSDSGLNGYKVYWQNYPGETPEIVGGTPVTGWTLYSGNIYMANVGMGLTFNALYENGARAYKTRYPKTGYLTDTNGSGGANEPYYQQGWFTAGSGDLPQQIWADMAGGEVYVWGYWNWFSSTLPIKTFDSTTQTVTLSRPPFWGLISNSTSPPPCALTTPPNTPPCKTQNSHDRYFIQNLMSILNSTGVAGEFYYNGATGYLYYYPRASPIGSQEIVLPQMKNIIEFTGASASNPIQNIQFQGIKVWGSDFTHSFDSWADFTKPILGGTGGTASQYESNEPPTLNRWGNIYVTNASNITLQTLEISAAGYNGVEMDQYAQNVAIVNSRIHDVGYNGVAINGGVNNLQDVLISENNQIQNNLIYNIGQLVGHGAGVHIEQSAANLVSHNEIHDGPRYGVNIVGSSDNPPTLHNLAANNVISHNKAYNLNTDSWDTGNFYQFAAGLNNLFDYNMSYNSYGGPSCTTNVNFYLDGGAQGATVSNSIGYNPTVLPFDSSLATTCNSSGDIINTACENSPNSTCTKNFVSIEAAVAAGLDITQMGRLPVNEPVPSVVAASLLLLLNNPAH
jgi:hypothetical protein